MVQLHTAVSEIKNRQVAPVYLLYGTETFLLEEFLSLIRQTVVDPSFAELNTSQYDCTEVPISVVLQDAETYPFLAEHRLVIAHNALFLTAAKQVGKVEHDPQALLDYLASPPAYTTLVLTVPAEKLDERKKLVKQLQQTAHTISFQPLRESELYTWVERQAKRYRLTIQREQVITLIERAGGDLRLLDRELEKLSLYLGDGATVTNQSIQLLVPRTLEQDVFQLVEAVIAGRMQDAFRILADCFTSGEEPIRLLALLARQFRLLLQVKLWAPRGYTQQQLAGMFKVHPYAVKKAMQQSHHFDERGLRRLLGMIAEEDFRMKSGQVDKRLAIELLIARVAGEIKK